MVYIYSEYIPLYRKGKWGLEKFSNLPTVTQQISDGVGIQPRFVWLLLTITWHCFFTAEMKTLTWHSIRATDPSFYKSQVRSPVFPRQKSASMFLVPTFPSISLEDREHKTGNLSCLSLDPQLLSLRLTQREYQDILLNWIEQTGKNKPNSITPTLHPCK